MGRDLFDKFEVVEVIKITVIRGSGTSGDQYRSVEKYFDMFGKVITEIDSLTKKEVNITS